ncbi:hypothetical protein WJX81_004548 [Elliptochloris bilobata]|uniref:Ketoreductase domain-containing protein n=1 Tax=Elliptochloris bilobata TaxID=381761 RepID=A0AAW1S1P5_9CHLO
MVAKVYVVTGASRGLGLGLVAGLMKQDGTVVVAAARNPGKSDALQKLVQQYPGRIHTVVLDTEDVASDAAASVDSVIPEGVDVLVNMAGIMDDQIVSALQTDGSDYMRVLKVNVVGSFLTTQAFYPLLKKRDVRIIVNVSSLLGSIGNQRAGAVPLVGKAIAYLSSKAALNMQTAVLASALKDEGFTVVSTCPGWVATDMGSRSDTKEAIGAEPGLTVEQSTEKHLALISKLAKHDNGKYISAVEDKEYPY